MEEKAKYKASRLIEVKLDKPIKLTTHTCYVVKLPITDTDKSGPWMIDSTPIKDE